VKNAMANKIGLIVRLAIGGLFIVSGYLKLMQPYENFLAVVKTYEILDGNAAQIFAQWMPWFEFILGIFLFLGLWTRTALTGLWLMNSLFIIALSMALIRKSPIEQCGCFGEKLSVPPQWMLVIDICLWAAFFVMFKFLGQIQNISLDKKLQ
jgi:uncharacterized membrane protein YphA (DoxX/SURF4 family)